VREAKTAKRATRVAKGASVVEAARMMLSEDVDELPVVDGEDVVGVVTERDLVSKVMAGELDPARARVADVYSERTSS
jgi:CBS domain-containing protein